jgi:hypothetical protein
LIIVHKWRRLVFVSAYQTTKTDGKRRAFNSPISQDRSDLGVG